MDVPRPRRSPYPRLARAIGVGMAGVVGVAAGIGVLAKASIVWLEKTTPLAAATTSPARPVGVEIPETYELANVAIALTNFAERRRHTIYRDSPYYASVMARFGERRTHPLITRLNEQLDGPNEWRAFYGFRENSVSFEIEGERLRRSSRYPAAIWRGNVFADDSALVADFARVTNFHEFYEKNRAFYRGQIAEYQRETPIAKMWDWLEARFPNRYDRYRVVFSPLSYGSHSTQRFTEGGVSETIMFIAGPFATATAVNSRLREAIASKIVFTEIDHNYVNPVSDRHRERIDSVFADIRAWNHDTQGGMYDYAYSTFNEYMTWGVFSLYALDTFDRETFDALQADLVKQMEGPRGFVRFGAFNKKLLEVYQAERSHLDIDRVYEMMLTWAASS